MSNKNIGLLDYNSGVVNDYGVDANSAKYAEGFTNGDAGYGIPEFAEQQEKLMAATVSLLTDGKIQNDYTGSGYFSQREQADDSGKTKAFVNATTKERLQIIADEQADRRKILEYCKAIKSKNPEVDNDSILNSVVNASITMNVAEKLGMDAQEYESLNAFDKYEALKKAGFIGEYDSKLAKSGIGQIVSDTIRTGVGRLTNGLDAERESDFDWHPADENNTIDNGILSAAKKNNGVKSNDDLAKLALSKSADGMMKIGDGDYIKITKIPSADGDKFSISVADNGWYEKISDRVYEIEKNIGDPNRAYDALIVSETLKNDPFTRNLYDIGRKNLDELKSFIKEDYAAYSLASVFSETDKKIANEKFKSYIKAFELLNLNRKHSGFAYKKPLGMCFSAVANTIGEVGSGLIGMIPSSIDGWKRSGKELAKWMYGTDPNADINAFDDFVDDNIKMLGEKEYYSHGTLLGDVSVEAMNFAALGGAIRFSRTGELAKLTGSTVRTTGKAVSKIGKISKSEILSDMGKGIRHAGNKIKSFGIDKVGGKKYLGFRVCEDGERGGIDIRDGKVKPIYVDVEPKTIAEHTAKVNAAKENLKKALEDQKKINTGLIDEFSYLDAEAKQEAVRKAKDGIQKLADEYSAEAKSKKWAIAKTDIENIINELPALSTMAMSQFENTATTDSYIIGQEMSDGFNPSALNASRKWEFYDAAGTQLFFLHLAKPIEDVMKGKIGSAKLRNSMNAYIRLIGRKLNDGDLVSANKLKHWLEMETILKTTGKRTLDNFVTGTGMADVEFYTDAMKQVDVSRKLNPNDQKRFDELVTNTDKTVEILGKGASMAVAGQGLEGISAVARKVSGKKGIIDDIETTVSAQRTRSAISRETLANAAIDAFNDKTAGKQERLDFYKLKADYTIALAKDALAGVTGRNRFSGDNYHKMRDEMRERYGEDLLKQLDSVFSQMDALFSEYEIANKFSSEVLGVDDPFGIKSGIEHGIKKEKGHYTTEEWNDEKIARTLYEILGVKANVENGKINITSSDGTAGTASFEYGKPTERTLGSTDEYGKVYNSAWSGEAVKAIETIANKSLEGPVFDELRTRIRSLTQEQKNLLYTGHNVNGLLDEIASKLKPEGGDFTRSNHESGMLGFIHYNKNENGGITGYTVSHEVAHAIFELARRSGLLTTEIESEIKKAYGNSDTWEENAIGDIINGKELLEGIENATISILSDPTTRQKLVNFIGRGLSAIKKIAKYGNEEKNKIEKFIESRERFAQIATESENLKSEYTESSNNIVSRANEIFDETKSKEANTRNDYITFGTDVDIWPRFSIEGGYQAAIHLLLNGTEEERNAAHKFFLADKMLTDLKNKLQDTSLISYDDIRKIEKLTGTYISSGDQFPRIAMKGIGDDTDLNRLIRVMITKGKISDSRISIGKNNTIEKLKSPKKYSIKFSELAKESFIKDAYAVNNLKDWTLEIYEFPESYKDTIGYTDVRGKTVALNMLWEGLYNRYHAPYLSETFDHEVSHISQIIENFAIGSNDDGIADRRNDKSRNEIIDKVVNLLKAKSKTVNKDAKRIYKELITDLDLCKLTSSTEDNKSGGKEKLPKYLLAAEKMLGEENKELSAIFDKINKHRYYYFSPFELYMLTEGEANARAFSHASNSGQISANQYVDVPRRLLIKSSLPSAIRSNSLSAIKDKSDGRMYFHATDKGKRISLEDAKRDQSITGFDDRYISNNHAKFSLESEIESDGILTATHNLGIDKMTDILENPKRKGFLVVPSVAIKSKDNPHLTFGSFSIILPKQMIDTTNGDVVLFGADVGSYSQSINDTDLSNTKLMRKAISTDIGKDLIHRDYDYSLKSNIFGYKNIDAVKQAIHNISKIGGKESVLQHYAEGKIYGKRNIVGNNCISIVAPEVSEQEFDNAPEQYKSLDRFDYTKNKYFEIMNRLKDIGVDLYTYNGTIEDIFNPQSLPSKENRILAIQDAQKNTENAIFEIIGDYGLEKISSDAEFAKDITKSIASSAIGQAIDFDLKDGQRFIGLRKANGKGNWHFFGEDETETGKAIRIPQAFIKRITNDEIIHVNDVMNKKRSAYEIYAKAYPEIFNAPIRAIQRRRFGDKKKYSFPVPEFGKNFIVANQNGEIIVDADRFDANKAPKQLAGAIAQLIQKKESVPYGKTKNGSDISRDEYNSKESIFKVFEDKYPQAKRMNSDLTIWLTDRRMLDKTDEHNIIVNAVRKHIKNRNIRGLSEGVAIEKAITAISKVIEESSDYFAGAMETKVLGDNFGCTPEEAATEYENARADLQQALIGVKSTNTTSADAMRRTLAFYDKVAMDAVDQALFGKHVSGKRRPSLRPEFKEALGEEIFRATIENILRGTRKTRTLSEEYETGVSVGTKRGGGSVGIVGNAAQSGESIDGAVDAEGNAIEISQGGGNGVSKGGIGVGIENQINISDIKNAIANDAKWKNNKHKAVDAIKKMLMDVRGEIMKDPTKAMDMKSSIEEKTKKIIAEYADSTDLDVLRQMRHDAVNEALGINSNNAKFSTEEKRLKYELSAYTPEDDASIEDYITEAAAAKLVNELAKTTGNKGYDDRVKKYISEQLVKCGLKHDDEAVKKIYAESEDIALELSNTLIGKADDASMALGIKNASRRNRIIRDVYDSFRSGHGIGAGGEKKSRKAKEIADNAKKKIIKESKGLSIIEVNASVGMNTLNDVRTIGEDNAKYSTPEAFAADFVKGVSDTLRKRDTFSWMSDDEFINDPKARQELAITAASWMRHIAKSLVYGQERQALIRDSERINELNATFPAIQKMISHHARIAYEYIRRHDVNQLIGQIEDFIDDNAMGDERVKTNIASRNRTIAPNLQEYWRYVKKAMRMTGDASKRKISEIETELGLTYEDTLKAKTEESTTAGISEWIEKRAKLLREMNALYKYGGMYEKTYAEVRDAFNEEIGPDIASEAIKWEIEQIRIERAMNASRKALIDGLRPWIAKDSALGKDPTIRSSISRNFLIKNTPDLFKRLTMHINQDTKAYEEITKIRQAFSLANIDRTLFISRQEEEMRNVIKSIYGREFEDIIPELMSKRQEYAKFSRKGWNIDKSDLPETDVEINGKTRNGIIKAKDAYSSEHPFDSAKPLSKANLIYIYAACRQRDMAINNFIYGRDAMYFAEIEREIGPEGIALANWMVKAYDAIRNKISPISEALTGIKVLSPDENYIPLSFEHDDISYDINKFSTSIFPKFLTRREMHNEAKLEEDVDIFRMYENRLQAAGHYAAFGLLTEKCNRVLKDPTVQNAYYKMYGKKAKDEIYSQLSAALTGGRNDANGLCNGLRNFVTATSLFYNPTSAIKQIEGTAGWSVPMGMTEFCKAIAKRGTFIFDADSRQGTRELLDAGLFEVRSKEGLSESMIALMDAMNDSDAFHRKALWKKARDLYYKNGMAFTKLVDHLATRSLAGSYYMNRKKFYLDGGFGEEIAKRNALADTDYAIQISQQSGRPEFYHEMQRSGVAGKMLTQFMGPSLIRWGEEIESIHRAFVLGDKGAMKTMFSKIAALHIVCPAVLAFCGSAVSYVTGGFDENDDAANALYAAILTGCLAGGMSGWFIFGQIVNAGLYMVTDKESVATGKLNPSIPVVGKLSQIMRGTTRIAERSFELANYGLIMEAFKDDTIRKESIKLLKCFFPILRTIPEQR